MPHNQGNKTAILYFDSERIPEDVKDKLSSQGYDVVDASVGDFIANEEFSEIISNTSQYDNVVVLYQPTGNVFGADSFKLNLISSTLKRYNPNLQVDVLAPFTPYMRQDREFEDRQVSLALEVFANNLKNNGCDSFTTFSPHSKAGCDIVRKYFTDSFMPVSMTETFASHVRQNLVERFGLENVAVGAPDGGDKAEDEGQKRANELKDALGISNIFKISKTHIDVNETAITAFNANVAGKHCVIIDDMIDGGSTMIKAAQLLKKQGATSVTCIATHGIFSDDPEKGKASIHTLLQSGDIDKLVVADWLNADKLQNYPEYAGRWEVVSIADEIAAQVARASEKKVYPEHSVTVDVGGGLRLPRLGC